MEERLPKSPRRGEVVAHTFVDRKYRQQWWHYVGALKTREGDLFGVQCSVFHMNHGDVAFAHCAMTDVNGGIHARHELKPEECLHFKVYDDSEVQHRIKFPDVELQFCESLPLQIYPSETSAHFGFPRMRVTGNIYGQPVDGVGCYDRECFDRLLKPGEVGWEWIIAWFDDGTWEMGYAFLAPDGSATRTPLPLSFVYHGQPYGATALVLGLWPQGKFNAPYEESLKEIVTLERKVYPRIGLAFHERVPNIDL